MLGQDSDERLALVGAARCTPRSISLGDGKSVLKGGWGRFVKLREVNPEVTAANRNNRATTTWVWRDLNNNRDYDAGEVDLDPNGPDFRVNLLA